MSCLITLKCLDSEEVFSHEYLNLKAHILFKTLALYVIEIKITYSSLNLGIINVICSQYGQKDMFGPRKTWNQECDILGLTGYLVNISLNYNPGHLRCILNISVHLKDLKCSMGNMKLFAQRNPCG